MSSAERPPVAEAGAEVFRLGGEIGHDLAEVDATPLLAPVLGISGLADVTTVRAG